jgi:protoporphyrinogen/coproporphyrinogen III oxidase
VTTSNTPHVVVVGGGISGLTAAYRLQQSGVDLRVTLLEASDYFGGKLRTEVHDGLTIEAGPDSFLSYKPAAINLARELGIEGRVIGTRESSDGSQNGGGTFILKDGRLEPLPEGITMLVPTKIQPLVRSRLLSTRGKLRMAAEYFVSSKNDDSDESIGSFISRRLGREVFERMAQPLLSGIYAGDADQLSLAATFPRLREIERKHGGLVRGMLAQRRGAANRANGQKPAYTPFVSFAGGMGELAGTLVSALERVDLRANCAVERIHPDGSRYSVLTAQGDTVTPDAVLLGTPAYVTADLLQLLDGELAALLRRIPYVSTATISLAYRKHALDPLQAGRGFVIPSVENRELTAVTWVSNKFEGRAPEEISLLRTFVGRAGREGAVDLADDELLALVRRELREMLDIESEPVMSRVYRWQQAMPQYNLGHLGRLQLIDQRIAAMPGIALMGAGYRGVGIPDCIESGTRAAQQALDNLKAQEH